MRRHACILATSFFFVVHTNLTAINRCTYSVPLHFALLHSFIRICSLVSSPLQSQSLTLLQSSLALEVEFEVQHDGRWHTLLKALGKPGANKQSMSPRFEDFCLSEAVLNDAAAYRDAPLRINVWNAPKYKARVLVSQFNTLLLDMALRPETVYAMETPEGERLGKLRIRYVVQCNNT
jgi:hypothetical protein